MKILAINGSPNCEGTTSGLIDVLLEECQALGAKCDKINIEDYHILCCQGCYNCSDKVVCRIDDDFMQLKARIMDADGIIIGSPYYNGRPVEQVEVLADRISLSAFVNKEFCNKYFVGVSSSAVDDGTNVAQFCANFGYDISKGGAVVSGVLWESMVLDEGIKEVRQDEAIRNKARNVANKLISDIKNNEKSLAATLCNLSFPGWLNFIVIRYRREKDFYAKKFFEYLKEKGLVKDSRRMV